MKQMTTDFSNYMMTEKKKNELLLAEKIRFDTPYICGNVSRVTYMWLKIHVNM